MVISLKTSARKVSRWISSRLFQRRPQSDLPKYLVPSAGSKYSGRSIYLWACDFVKCNGGVELDALFLRIEVGPHQVWIAAESGLRFESGFKAPRPPSSSPSILQTNQSNEDEPSLSNWNAAGRARNSATSLSSYSSTVSLEPRQEADYWYHSGRVWVCALGTIDSLKRAVFGNNRKHLETVGRTVYTSPNRPTLVDVANALHSTVKTMEETDFPRANCYMHSAAVRFLLEQEEFSVEGEPLYGPSADHLILDAREAIRNRYHARLVVHFNHKRSFDIAAVGKRKLAKKEAEIKAIAEETRMQDAERKAIAERNRMKDDEIKRLEALILMAKSNVQPAGEPFTSGTATVASLQPDAKPR